MASQLERQKSVAEIIGSKLLQLQIDVNKTKQDFTYDVLVGITCLNSGATSSEGQEGEQNKDIADRKKRLLEAYIKAVNSIDQQYVKKEIEYIKLTIQEYKEEIRFSQNKLVQDRMVELLEIQTKLRNFLRTIFQDTKEYIQKVTLRIKHERYLDDQTQIDAYVQRQQFEIEEQKGDIQRIIRNKNDQIKKLINIAKGICKEKETYINELKQENQIIQKKLQNTTQLVEQVNMKQRDTYKNIANLTEEILHIKAQNKAKFRQVKKIDLKPSEQRIRFESQNLGSEIISSGKSSIQPSSIFLPELNREDSKPSAKCEIVGSDFKSGLIDKKFIIFVMVVLSLVLYFW